MTLNKDLFLSQLDDAMIEALRHVHVNVPWKLFPDYLQVVLDLRINIEIGIEGDQLDGTPRSMFQSTAEKLHRNGCGITLHGPFWDLSPGSSDRLVRQASQFRYHQLFDLVEIFEPIQVVCHTGYDPNHHGNDHRFYLDRSLAVWEPIAGRAETYGVPLLFENVWEQGPELHRDLFGRLNGHHFGFCLDVGHQHTFSNTSLGTWIAALGDFLKEVHMHDNDGLGDDHLPVGQGTIDFGSLFRLLHERSIKPVLTLEPHREEHFAESLAGLVKVMHLE
jgi:sugar phosphate isomerase/epimerase